MKNYLPELWEQVEGKHTAIERKVYEYLNHDYINAIQAEGKHFWIEKISESYPLPNYVFSYIVRFMQKRGFTYLYSN